MDKRAIETLANGEAKLKALYKQNLSAREVKALDIKIVVADPEWQKIRSDLKGTWKNEVYNNIKILRAYVGDMSDPFKVRRVLNYITGSAFRIGIIHSPALDKFREIIQKKWQQMT